MDEITKTESGSLNAMQEAVSLDHEIKAEAENVARAIVRIGRALKKMNDRGLYRELGYSSLGEYSYEAVGLKERAAYNYIKCFETYGDNLIKYETLGVTKLSLIAQLDAIDRAEMLESGNAETMSTRELEEEIKRLKNRCEQLTFELEEQKTPVEIIDKAEITEAEKEDMRKAIEAETEMRHLEAMKELETELKEKAEKDISQRDSKLRETVNELDSVKKELDRAKTEADKSKADAEKELKKAEKKAAETEEERKKLVAEINALKSQNQKLQANAEAKPKPSGNKEILKMHAENFSREFAAAVEVAKRFEGEERESFKAWLIGTVENMKGAVEGI